MWEAAPGKKILGCHSSDPELPKESFVHQLSGFHSGMPILATNGGPRSITSFSDSKSSAASPPDTTRPTPSSPPQSILLTDECLQTLLVHQTASFSWRSEPPREPEHGRGTHTSRDLTLEEMLADPIVQLVLRRDNIVADDVRDPG